MRLDKNCIQGVYTIWNSDSPRSSDSWRIRRRRTRCRSSIVDGDGVIRFSHVAPYIHHVPDIYELFKVLDSLQTERPASVEVTT